MFPPEPSNIPHDPVVPVPLPPLRYIAPLSFGALATVLAALSMLGPFSIDAYLPAFPQIESNLHASLLTTKITRLAKNSSARVTSR